MEKSRPIEVTLVAILQFIPILLLPPSLLFSVNPVLFVAPLVLFAFLGWGMLTLRKWSTTLCIFVQGLSVIARFLILFPQAIGEGSADWAFIVTSIVSILLSVIILYAVDQPKVQVAFA